MAYSQAIVQRAMQRLQSENEQNEQSSRARIAAIYEKEPRLGEIERELRRTAAHVLAATFRRQGDPVAAMQQLKRTIWRSSRSATGFCRPRGWSLTI